MEDLQYVANSRLALLFDILHHGLVIDAVVEGSHLLRNLRKEKDDTLC